MGNKKITYNEKTWKFLSIVFAVLFCVVWLVYCYKNYINDTINIAQIASTIATIIGTTVTIITFLALNKKKTNENNANSTQEKNSQKKETPGQRNTWFNFDYMWFFLALVMVLFFVGSLIFTTLRKVNGEGVEKPSKEVIIGEQNKDSLFVIEQQRKFNALVEKYKKRINQELKFQDAYELLVDDSIMLVQIMQMLDENPNLKVDTMDYSKQFESRAGEAIENINYAIFNLGLSHDDSLKYTKQKDKIEKMINSL